MARNGITYEAVADAAEQLNRQGVKATPTKVREIIGTGSFTTITKMLRSWQDRGDDHVEADPLDDEELRQVLAALRQPIAELVKAGADEREDNLQEDMAKLRRRATEAEDQADEAAAELDRLNDKLQDREETIKALRGALDAWNPPADPKKVTPGDRKKLAAAKRATAKKPAAKKAASKSANGTTTPAATS
jgi:chromosome segregation ATPase